MNVSESCIRSGLAQAQNAVKRTLFVLLGDHFRIFEAPENLLRSIMLLMDSHGRGHYVLHDIRDNTLVSLPFRIELDR